MKHSLISLMGAAILQVTCLLFAQVASGAIYYISSSSGDDTRSSNTATNPSTPWKSINKLNSFFSQLKPGDSVLFERGGVYRGSIKPSASGTSTARITIGAYGSGDLPVISGFINVSAWTSIGNGIYEASCPTTTDSVAVVVRNGEIQRLGRYPNYDATNKGYLIFESHSANSSITDNDVSLASWKGAEVVCRPIQHLIDRATITSNTGSTIYHSGFSRAPSEDGYGYFIQNHPNTLDQLGEWYFNASAKKIRIYWGSTTPESIKVSSLDYNVESVGFDYITYENIRFEGANVSGLKIYDSLHTQINNCEIFYSGQDGISALSSSYLTVSDCDIEWTLDSGIKSLWSGQSAVANSTFSGNTIRNINLFAGMGRSGEVKGMGLAVYGANNRIEYNRLENIGYCPIYFVYGGNNLIKNNVINNFCMTKNDGGAVYTWNMPSSPLSYKGNVITGNIILNGIGAREGTPLYALSSNGIYFDNNTANVTVSNNTIYNVDKGFFNYNSYSNTVTGNLFFNNRLGSIDINHSLANEPEVRAMNIQQNQCIVTATNHIAAIYRTIDASLSNLGTIDYNYYARPMKDDMTIRTIVHQFNVGGTQVKKDVSLSQWQTTYHYDLNSKKSPITYSLTTSPDSVVRFEYNDTDSAKTVEITTGYIDVTGKKYTSNFTLAPYASVVLLKDSSITTGTLPTITSATTATAIIDAAFKYQITASGSPTSFSTSTLPSGLSVNTTTGLISGTPTTTGTYSISLYAKNAYGTATKTLALTVNPASPVITSATNATTVVRASFQYQITASNSPTSFSASGLPQNLVLDSTTGWITGTVSTAGAYTIGLTATNAGGTTSATLTLVATADTNTSIQKVTSFTLVNADTATDIQTLTDGATIDLSSLATRNLNIRANTDPSVVGSVVISLSGALNASATENIAAYTLFGNGGSSYNGKVLPTGDYSLTATPYTLTNAGGTQGTTCTVSFKVVDNGAAPSITSATSTTATIWKPFTYQIIASGSPSSYNATGLPSGLTINTSTGLISGRPSQVGTFNVNVFAKNTAGSGSAALTLTIAKAKALFVVGSTTLNSGDTTMKSRVEQLGISLTIKSATAATSNDASSQDLVIISSTSYSKDVSTKYRTVAIPVVTWESHSFDDLGMTGTTSGTDYAAVSGQLSLSILNSTSPLAAGLTGVQTVYTKSGYMNFGKPNSNAIKIASLAKDSSKVVIFAYEKGVAMPGLTAPARRVGLFITDTESSNLTQAGKSLIDSDIKWALGGK